MLLYIVIWRDGQVKATKLRVVIVTTIRIQVPNVPSQ